MKKLFVLGACTLLASTQLLCALKNEAPSGWQKMIVRVPVTDLRSKPNPAPQGLKGPAMSRDIGDQDSQVYFSECVMAEEVQNNPDWMAVKVLGQKSWNKAEQKWEAYPGFILKSHLKPVKEFPKYGVILQNRWTPLYKAKNTEGGVVCRLGLATRLETKLINDDWEAVMINGEEFGYLNAHDRGIYELLDEVIEPAEVLRQEIVNHAKTLLGTPYVWGGRSPNGSDCSGTTNIALGAQGFEIPRDAEPQHRSSNKLSSGKELQPADLIFLARDEAGERINHVMMYIGAGKMIESVGSAASSMKEATEPVESLCARITSVKERLGVEVDQLESGKTLTPTGKYVFLGSYLNAPEKIQELRTAALG